MASSAGGSGGQLWSLGDLCNPASGWAAFHRFDFFLVPDKYMLGTCIP